MNFIFIFYNIVRLYYEKPLFIKFLLKIYIFAITNVFLNKLFNLGKILNIGDKMTVYLKNPKKKIPLQKAKLIVLLLFYCCYYMIFTELCTKHLVKCFVDNY